MGEFGERGGGAPVGGFVPLGGAASGKEKPVDETGLVDNLREDIPVAEIAARFNAIAKIREIKAWTRMFGLHALAMLVLASVASEVLLKNEEKGQAKMREVASRRKGGWDISLITTLKISAANLHNFFVVNILRLANYISLMSLSKSGESHDKTAKRGHKFV